MNQTNLAVSKKRMWNILTSKGCKDFILSHKFTYTSDPVEFIHSTMAAPGHVETRIFYPRWWQWTMKKVAAYTYRKKYPHTIFINHTILNWEPERIAAILIHELCHLRGYRHGANYLSGNRGKKYRGSVPVQLEYYAKSVDDRDI